MAGKLKNIKAIQEMLAGEHRTQTRKTFFMDSDTWEAKQQAAKVVRKVGDRWIEEGANGRKTYVEQKDGYRVKSNMDWEKQELFDKIRKESRTFMSCPKEMCTCINPSALDERFRRKMGMCHDCVVEMETRLKMHGKFDDYAKTKMRENAKAYFRDMEVEFERWKADIRSKMSFANGDTTIETWQSENPEILISKMEAEFNELKEMIFNSEIIKDESAQ